MIQSEGAVPDRLLFRYQRSPPIPKGLHLSFSQTCCFWSSVPLAHRHVAQPGIVQVRRRNFALGAGRRPTDGRPGYAAAWADSSHRRVPCLSRRRAVSSRIAASTMRKCPTLRVKDLVASDPMSALPSTSSWPKVVARREVRCRTSANPRE